MRFGIGFNHQGFFTTFPTVFTDINADDLAMPPSAPTGIMAILAAGAGFFPPKVPTLLPINVGSPQRFLTAGSDLLNSCNIAVPVFPDLGRGPNTIYVVPVTPATPATLPINSVTPTLLVTLTSKGWGLAFNALTAVLVGAATPWTLTLSLPTVQGTITEVYTFTSIDDLVSQIGDGTNTNPGRSGLVTAAKSASGSPVAFASTPFTGGTEPAPVSADWSDALTALSKYRVNCVHVATSDTSIWAMLATYAALKRLRGFVGSDIKNWNGISARATAAASLVTEAAGLNNARMMHVGLGMNGFAGKIAAARYAALAATLEPSVPMTFKHLGVDSLEAILDIDTEVGGEAGLLINGVSVPVPDPSSPNTFICSRGLSTYTGSDNLYFREQSVLAAVDGVQDLIEQGMREFLGREGRVVVIRRAIELVNAILKECTQDNSTVRINGYNPSSIHASFTSDTVLRIQADVEPIPPINFCDVGLRLTRTDISLDFNVNLIS